VSFNYAGHFERQTEVCGSALVVRGTRIPVRTLLASLAEGSTENEVLEDFRTVPPREPARRHCIRRRIGWRRFARASPARRGRMKLKLDENLAGSLVGELAALNFDADSVRQEELAGRADPDVWSASQSGDRFFITQEFGTQAWTSGFSETFTT
jgi:hypothetical protein